MATLIRAYEELFRRSPDECFNSFDALYQRCEQDRLESQDRWVRSEDVLLTHDMTVCLADQPDFQLNEWSFSQLCKMAGVSKDTLNRLSSKTASKALTETLPISQKPLQFLTRDERIRSVHGVAYTRLWNTELLDVVREFASDFCPPQTAMNGVSTGLYCGEQDMFAFLIDPAGWTEINGEEFAPGFFLWNSEVGRRTMGVQTFWFQKVCRNHIVWDATEVVEFARKHTANVRAGLNEIRSHIEQLAAKRDARKDGFATAIRNAMRKKLGNNADEVSKQLLKHGIPRSLIKEALKSAQKSGAFTIFSLVDLLTRESGKVKLAGTRAELDAKIGQLLALAV